MGKKNKGKLVKCSVCGVEFYAGRIDAKYCANCAREMHRKRCREYNVGYKATRRDARVYEGTEVLTYKQIRARARRVKVEAGWRGQRCMGGAGPKMMGVVR